ncbi:helix-turn-helix domain-containing protein [Hyphomicrobium sp.]|jgi:transcriptional regulator with XRE-family HTH domain|uniref:helix-turn-helix domain-containing protein n=1 Tax=Hyphomicrobium sp. TaxID=82 RepID=UPI003450248F
MDDLPTFDGRQLTAARALAEMTVADLAEKANVTPRTVHRIEIGGTVSVSPGRRHGHVSADVWDRIVAAVREAGVELLSEDSTHGSGVRWARSRSVRPKLPQE